MSFAKVDVESEEAVRRRNEEELLCAVRRQWKAGLADRRIAKVLGVSYPRVVQAREALGLPRNGRNPA